MKPGTGIDIIEIERLKNAVDKWGKIFLDRIFTKRELDYAKNKRFPMQHLAARFAAKEAVFKALGTNPALNFRDIEICNDRYGRPYCLIKNKKRSILVSISHTHAYAVASAIIQKGS